MSKRAKYRHEGPPVVGYPGTFKPLDAFEPAPASGTCSRIGCDSPAVKAHRSKYARRWWLGCAEHEAGMQSVLFLGQPSDSGKVDTVRLGAS